VRHIGLSEVSGRTLTRAAANFPIAALQIEYSLASRGIEREVLPAARALSVPVVVYGALSRGLISDAALAQGLASNGIRTRMPRFRRRISSITELCSKHWPPSLGRAAGISLSSLSPGCVRAGSTLCR